MKVSLIGFPGVGKTTVGKKLAKLLDIDFIDTDSYIEHQEGCAISTIITQNSETYFRELEAKALKEILLSKSSFVLSLGGGSPCFYNNMKLIKQYTFSIYLSMNELAIFDRLNNSKNTHRPFVAGKTEVQLKGYIKNTLNQRLGFYELADYTVNALNIDVLKLSKFVLSKC